MEMDRKRLLKLRPQIGKAKILEQMNAAEYFQNATLRPIIKFQHDLWLLWLEFHLEKYKIALTQKSFEEKTIFIQQFISKEKDLKNQCIGMVVGHFTLEEWEAYHPIAAETNKRIVTMVIQRLQHSFETSMPESNK